MTKIYITICLVIPVFSFACSRGDQENDHRPNLLIIQTDEPNSENRRCETICTPAPGKHYYFAKVTQADGNMLWSAPVWVTVGEK